MKWSVSRKQTAAFGKGTSVCVIYRKSNKCQPQTTNTDFIFQCTSWLIHRSTAISLEDNTFFSDLIVMLEMSPGRRRKKTSLLPDWVALTSSKKRFPFEFPPQKDTHRSRDKACGYFYRWMQRESWDPRERRVPGLDGCGVKGEESGRPVSPTALTHCLVGNVHWSVAVWLSFSGVRLH